MNNNLSINSCGYPKYKILKNFIPYNCGRNYKTCFHTALMSVIFGFNSNPNAYILNEIDLYNYNEINMLLEFDSISIRHTDQLLKNIDIKQEIKYKSMDILDDIRNSINVNRPVIVCIDTFFESIRTWDYKKVHSPHMLLVYGYNDDEKFLHVIEDQYQGEVNYINRVISYEDIINGYKGVFDNIDSFKNKPTYYEYYKSGNSKNTYENEYIINYSKFFVDNYNSIEKSLNNLRKFKENFSFIINKYMENSFNLLLECFWWIVQYKTGELEKISVISNYVDSIKNLEVNKIMNQIVQATRFISFTLLKYSKTNVLANESIEKCIEKLSEIYDLEKRSNELQYNSYKLVI